MTELQGKKEQGGQTQEASGTGDEERDPSASPTRREDPSSTSEGVVSVEVGSESINLARVDKAETTVSLVSPLGQRYGRQQYMGKPKMVPPVLKDRGTFPEFR